MQEPRQQHVSSLLGMLVHIADDVLSAVGTLASSASGTFLIPRGVNLLVLPRRNGERIYPTGHLVRFLLKIILAILLARDPSLPGPSQSHTERVPLIRFDLKVPDEVLESISSTFEEWDLLPSLAKSSQLKVLAEGSQGHPD